MRTPSNSLKIVGIKFQGGGGLSSFINVRNLVSWSYPFGRMITVSELHCKFSRSILLFQTKSDFSEQLHQLRQLETNETSET